MSSTCLTGISNNCPVYIGTASHDLVKLWTLVVLTSNLDVDSSCWTPECG